MQTVRQSSSAQFRGSPGTKVGDDWESKLLRAQGAVPPSLALELTYRCDRGCHFCLHRRRPPAVRRRDADMPFSLAIDILERASREGVERIHFTGGEPLTHPGFVSLVEHARGLGLGVTVSTGGSEHSGRWNVLAELADEVILPLREPHQRSWVIEGARRLRIRAREIRRNVRIRFGAVLTQDRIRELPSLAEMADAEQALLEVYRVMGVPGVVVPSTAEDLRMSVRALDALNRERERGRKIRMVNAIPFCLMTDHRMVARNSQGGRFDDGRGGLVVSSEGEVRPSYSLDLVLGSLRESSIAQLWASPQLRQLHSLDCLPAVCRRCPDVAICRGGSRYEAWCGSGDLTALDPVISSEPTPDAAPPAELAPPIG